MSQITPAQQLFDLTGQVALVTGASSGLGRRFAQVLAAQGAKVVAAARRSDRLQDLAATSPNIVPLAMDVTDTAAQAGALDAAERGFGPLTLLVNNAGIGGGGRIVDTPEAEWERVMRTNVDSIWHLSRASPSASSRANGQAPSSTSPRSWRIASACRRRAMPSARRRCCT